MRILPEAVRISTRASDAPTLARSSRLDCSSIVIGSMVSSAPESVRAWRRKLAPCGAARSTAPEDELSSQYVRGAGLPDTCRRPEEVEARRSAFAPDTLRVPLLVSMPTLPSTFCKVTCPEPQL